jgi:hypothetical protein
MQKYNNSEENLAAISEVSGYMLLKLNISQVEKMSKYGLSVDDVRYIPMFEEYLSPRRDGAKKKQTMEYLSGKYFVGLSTVKRVVKRLSQGVTQ